MFFRRAWPALFVLALGARAGDLPTPGWWRELALRDVAGAAMPAPPGWLVVVLLDPECPVANAAVPGLNALAAEFAPRGFTFVGAYTDPHALHMALRRHAADYALRFAAIDDRAQRLARFCGATYTPEAVVLSPAGDVLYRGRIDDRVGADGAARPVATRHDLRDVLRRLAAGERGPFAGEAGFGCALAARVSAP